ncbi:acyltransferase family protein [Rhabdothermincola salaria]|uniref:acyltransferase family protein n=1 Tax=Rhabdothermincola salaria TaxID=2903142 RepID=UPI001E654196|nr:acyltransferase [Rhabdothermincola salaria]MCD9624551.1 acyltransferase [Rhabdothermincola salaria]
MGQSTAPGAPVAAGPGRVHLSGLDGLRGLAVVLVVVFHFWPEVLPGGFLGVSLFFTLSGYLITGLLLAEHERHGRVDLRAFWGRRFRRLLPAALVTLAGVAVLAIWLTSPADLADEIVAALAYVYNWYLIATGGDYGALFSQPSPIEHFWSLAIEEQFYVVFPAVAVVALRAGRRGLGVVVGVLLAGSVALNLSGALAPAEAYLSTLTRAAEILVGALLAVVVPVDRVRAAVEGRVVRWVAATMGAVAVVAVVASSRWFDYDEVVAQRGFLVMFACVSAVAIVGAASVPVTRVLGTAVPRWLGQRSYGIYLVHWPIEVWMPAPGAVKVVVTLALAELSYRLVETPIRSRRVLVATPRALVAGVVAVSLVAVVAIAPVGFGAGDASSASSVVTVPPRDLESPAPSTAGGAVDPGAPPPSAVLGAVEEAAAAASLPESAAPPAPAAPAAVAGPSVVWVLGDSQAHGLLDWVTGRRDPQHELLWGREAPTAAYPQAGSDGEMVVVDLAMPACEGGRGVVKLRYEGRAVDENPRCQDWPTRWGEALAAYGAPDVVVWIVGGATVWIPRSFDAAPEEFAVPTDEAWQRWWPGSVHERLDWITVHAPDARVVWTTPVLPTRSEYVGAGSPDDEAWHRIVVATDVVADLQRRIARDRLRVVVADLGGWAETAGSDGGPLGGTFDGVHWDRRTSVERIWPWLLDQVSTSRGR